MNCSEEVLLFKLKIAFNTLGCKANKYDTMLIEQNLKQYPVEITDFENFADIYIINTCSVTNHSDMESRQLIRKAKKHNPNAEILVTGCYVDVSKDNLEIMNEITKLFTNKEKNLIAKYIKEKYFDEIQAEEITFIHQFEHQTRPFIKIQDGCLSFCSYCVIPYARSVMQSMEKEKIVEQINIFSKNGYKEVVLTGIHLGYYGLDIKNEKINLNSLLKYLDINANIERIRISSIDPHEIDEEFVDIIKNSKKFQNHLHIALQYGNDFILEKMRRNYSVEQSVKNIKYAQEQIKDLNIGFDIIVGFPFENDESFEETYKTVELLNPGYLHVFPYSKRPLTEASKYNHSINGTIIKERSKKLRNLGEQLKIKYINSKLNEVYDVLFEEVVEIDNKKYLSGYTSNYLNVFVEQSSSLTPNSIHKIKLTHIDNNNLFGICKE